MYLRKCLRSRGFKFWVGYTLSFAAAFFISYIYFFKNGLSFIWGPDGYPLHGINLISAGAWVRDSLKKLFHLNFDFSQINFSLGLGTDRFISTGVWWMDFFSFFFAPFARPDNIETIYALIIVARFYGVGISFGAYALYRRKPVSHAVLGALAAVFTDYAFYMGMRHPYFFTGAFFFPLLCIGVEKIWDGKKGLFLLISVALLSFSSYYILFIDALFLVIYYILRFISRYPLKSLGPKKATGLFFGKGIHAALVSALGVGLAAPSIMARSAAFFGSIRTSRYIATPSLFSYGPGHLKNLAYFFFQPTRGLDFWIMLGFAVPTLAALTVLLRRFRKKEHAVLLIGTGLMMLFLSVPLFGLIFSGFGNVGNRWSYMVSLMLAWVLVNALPYLFKPDLLDVAAAAAVSLIYGLAVFRMHRGLDLLLNCLLILLACFVMLLAVLAWPRRRGKKSGQPRLQPRGQQALAFALLLIFLLDNIFYTSYGTFSDNGLNYGSEFVKQGTFIDHYDKFVSSAVKEIDDSESHYRVDRMHSNPQDSNYFMLTGSMGLASCFGVRSRRFTDFMTKLENVGMFNSNLVYSLDNRAALNALTGVKYILRDAGYREAVPQGYKKISSFKRGKRTFEIYENENPLPLFQRYEEILPESRLEEADPVLRQQLYLRSAVLPDEEADLALPLTDERRLNELESRTVAYENVPYTLENVESQDGVHQTNSKSKLVFHLPEDAEGNIYLRFRGLEMPEKGTQFMSFRIRMKQGWKSVTLLNTSNLYGFGAENYTAFMGDRYKPGEKAEVLISRGSFTLDGLDILTEPLPLTEDGILERREQNEGSVFDIRLSDNKAAAKVSQSAPSIVMCSMAAEEGWKAYVDGRPSELKHVQGLFLGVEVPEGDHEVVFVYQNPGLLPGFIVMAVSILLLAAALVSYEVWKRRKIRMNPQKDEEQA